MTEPADLVFNGIDGSTGAPYYPDLPVEDVAALALGRRPDPKTAARERRRADAERPHLGMRDGLDPRLLADGGWGVVFARDAGPEIREALDPLLRHRQAQAAARDERRFRIFAGKDGVHPGDTPETFLRRHRMSLDAADPDVVPYNLLLAGGPEEIPWDFQHGLDLQYAVGRICFDTPDEYDRYARAVLTAEATETAEARSGRRAVFFGVQNPGDRPTRLMAEHLLGRVASVIEKDRPAWPVERILGESATKARLAGLLSGDDTPALLFATCHGMGFPKDDPRQLRHQGALLCQDWPGQGWKELVPEDHYLSGDDIGADARPAGLIAFLHACHGAGTPLQDAYPERTGKRRDLAPHPLAARLPQRLLAAGALAVIGHVERTWGYSFLWEGAGAQTGPFEDSLKRLLDGWPIGAALEPFVLRRAFLSDQLMAAVRDAGYGIEIDPKELVRKWTAHHDARGYALLGDPAVRLSGAAPAPSAAGSAASPAGS